MQTLIRKRQGKGKKTGGILLRKHKKQLDMETHLWYFGVEKEHNLL